MSEDSEREELADALMRIAEDPMHFAQYCDEESLSEVVEAAQLLRRPVEPVVTAHEDYISHHEDWRSACEIAMQHADCASDRAYWQHQIDTLDKIAALNVSQPGVK